VDERLDVTEDRVVVDRVPVTAELGDDFGHRACGWRPTRQAGDGRKSAWPEFDSFARVENSGCRKNWWTNLSPDKRTAFADEGNHTVRGGGLV
jgi:hypothetical protein